MQLLNITVQLLNIAVQLLNIAVQLENNCTATNGKIYTGYAITYGKSPPNTVSLAMLLLTDKTIIILFIRIHFKFVTT